MDGFGGLCLLFGHTVFIVRLLPLFVYVSTRLRRVYGCGSISYMAGNTFEAMQAHAGEWLSRTSVKYASIGRLVIGDPRINRVVYGVSVTPASAIPDSSRADFRGTGRGTRLPWPARFKMAGVVQLDRAVLDAKRSELSAENPGSSVHEAVAFQFGKFVMAGVLEEGDRLPEEFAMRFQRYDLSATAGLVIPEEGTLVVPEGVVRTAPGADGGVHRVSTLLSAARIPIY